MLEVITQRLSEKNARLVAVSKTHPPERIMPLYLKGQRIFGENRVQELQQKYEVLPKDIEWHLIGHLQTNKFKFIAPYISLVHSVVSLDLLKEINKQPFQVLHGSRHLPALLLLCDCDPWPTKRSP